MRLFWLALVVFSLGTISFAQPEPMQTGIEGSISMSPAFGGPARIGVPNSRPIANAVFVVANATGQVATFKTDAEGKFRVSLGAGRYSVTRKDAPAKGIGHCGPFEVDVVAGQIAKVEWTSDSGMR